MPAPKKEVPPMGEKKWIAFDRNFEERVFNIWPPITGEAMFTDPRAFVPLEDFTALWDAAEAVVNANNLLDLAPLLVNLKAVLAALPKDTP